MSKTVIGLFDYEDDAHNAVRDLLKAGFTHEDVSLVANHSESRYGVATTSTVEEPAATDATAEGAGAGAVIGGLAGLALGLGTVAIPGFGPVLAAGWIGTTLAGAGMGAVAGGLIGALVSAGVPEEHAQTYAEGVSRGGLIVLVRTEDFRAEQAAAILEDNSAVDVDRRSAGYQAPEPKPVDSVTGSGPELSEIDRDEEEDVHLTPTPAINNADYGLNGEPRGQPR